MRLFVATFFSEGMLDWLLESGMVLSDLFPARALRLTSRENLHLTFQFLGEVQGSRIGQISRAVEEAISDLEAFYFHPGLVGVFPNKFRPRTLWIGLEPAEAFQSVAKKINSGLEKVVQTNSKRFLPHVTLGRFNEEHAALGTVDPSAATLPLFNISDQERFINSVAIYRSELTQRGPIYSELSHIDLNNYAKL